MTGRFSCAEVPLLSIPQRYGLRECFEAAPGNSLVRADFSCFEQRVLAALANDKALLDIFRQGDDAHVLIAAELLAKDSSLIAAAERARIKPVSFGVVFELTAGGCGIVAFAREQYGVELSLAEAEAYHQAFFKRFTGVDAWRKAVLAQCANFSKTRLGRFREWKVDDRDGARLAFEVQGSAADVMKMCLSGLHGPLEKLGAWVILVVHDEIVVESAKDAAPAVVQLLKAAMPSLASRLFPEVPFLVNVSTCQNLGG